MDIEETLQPKSEQLDNIELVSGPRVFQVERVEVRKGSDQPVQVWLVGFPRPWKPGVNMRRVLAHYWGTDSSTWIGRWLELFRDPEVTYGRDKTGGTRIGAMSDIDPAKTAAPVLLSQGRAGTYSVRELADGAPSRDWRAEADALTDADALRDLYREAPAEARGYIAARAQALTPEGSTA